MQYAVVIEKAEGNFSAYVPDLTGCVATGDTATSVEHEIREAIRFHIEGLKQDGLDVPTPNSIAEYRDRSLGTHTQHSLSYTELRYVAWR